MGMYDTQSTLTATNNNPEQLRQQPCLISVLAVCMDKA